MIIKKGKIESTLPRDYIAKMVCLQIYMWVIPVGAIILSWIK